MPEVLTALKVKHQKPDPKRRLEIADAALPGLYLIVQSNGKKSWAVRYRAAGPVAKVDPGPHHPDARARRGP